MTAESIPSVAPQGAPSAWPVVLLLGLAHMVVDATSIYAAMAGAGVESRAAGSAELMIGYTLLAFATQPVFGWMADLLQGRLGSRAPMRVATAGAFMAVAAGIVAGWAGVPAVVFAGIGNALFHVGAGSFCLQLGRGRSAMPGAFVAPGDMGVVVGTFLGFGTWGGAGWVVAACAAAGLLTAMVPAMPASPSSADQPTRPTTWGASALVLLCLAVAARSWVGVAVGSPWLERPGIWVAVMASAMIAKYSGLIADRIGWGLFAVPCALAAAPLLGMHASTPAVAILATLFVQGAMPVTLAATARIMHGRSGLAFGLASFSIAVGALPGMLNWGAPTGPQWASIQIACAAVIGVALWLRGDMGRPGVANPRQDLAATPINSR